MRGAKELALLIHGKVDAEEGSPWLELVGAVGHDGGPVRSGLLGKGCLGNGYAHTVRSGISSSQRCLRSCVQAECKASGMAHGVLVSQCMAVAEKPISTLASGIACMQTYSDTQEAQGPMLEATYLLIEGRARGQDKDIIMICHVTLHLCAIFGCTLVSCGCPEACKDRTHATSGLNHAMGVVKHAAKVVGDLILVHDSDGGVRQLRADTLHNGWEGR